MMLKLPEKFKSDWLAALRSGQIRQDVGKLKTWHGMCCLGVACHISGTNFFHTGLNYETSHGNMYTPGTDDVPIEVYEVLNQPLRDILGANCELGSAQTYLASMNDRREPFSRIADWIEKHL